MRRRRRRGTLRRFIIGAVAFGVLAAPGTAAGGTMTADELLRQLAASHALVLDGVTVTDPVRLEQLGVVHAAFECRSCTFLGGISARHVVFMREIDLGGAEIKGDLDLASATFAGPVVLGSPAAATRIAGQTNFRLATFGDAMDAERVVFRGPADFTLARFRGEAIFSDAEFKGAARFAGVSFDGRARFSGGTFVRDQDFAGAVFGSTADFRSRVFKRGCNFGSVNFRGLADFGQTTFEGVAKFDDARLERDASFRGATFAASADPTDDRALSMEYAVAQEELSFDAATFYKFVLVDYVVARKLTFDDVSFEGPAQITLSKLNVEDLSYPLGDVARLVDDQQRLDVLGKIETSAKNRGDIGLANEARYQLQKLTASGYGVFWRTADAVFYRGIAGYFVDPRRPLVLLLILALAFSVLRWLSRPDGATSRAVRPHGARVWRRVPSWARRSWLWLVGLVTHFVDTLGHTIPHLRASENEPEERTVRRRFEVLGYRVLLVCALIGLANSNPTLRQMFDALT